MNKKELKNSLAHSLRMGGMLGVNNKYISSEDLSKESLYILGELPEFDTKEEYKDYMREKAEESNFYSYLSEKYSITIEDARRRFLSDANLYYLL